MMRVILVLTAVAATSALRIDPLSDGFLENLQSKQSAWKAGRNFAKDTPKEYLHMLACDTPGENDDKIPLKTITIPEGFDIPDTFDSREAWPDYPTISEIKDQGSCGSCWAVASTSVMSDRSYIHGEGKLNIRYSSENMAACCETCGRGGCFGGSSASALYHWQHFGVVSGGRYNSSEGCQPYSVPECEHYVEGPRPNCTHDYPILRCETVCREGFEVEYHSDRHFGETVYEVENDVAKIQYEILTNGPVMIRYYLYEDFLHYQSGVYQHVEGEFSGAHAMRIIGWGEEDATPYWLVANSWNYDWGEKGFVKILMGVNECSVEEFVYGATPYLPK